MEPGGGRCTAVEPSEGKSAAMEPGRVRSTTVELIASRSTTMEPGGGRSTAVEPDGGAPAPPSRASLGHARGPTSLDPCWAALCHHSEGVGRPVHSRERPLCHGCARLPLSFGREGSPWPLREKGLHRRSVWGESRRETSWGRHGGRLGAAERDGRVKERNLSVHIYTLETATGPCLGQLGLTF